jgi:hypothetical protein
VCDVVLLLRILILAPHMLSCFRLPRPVGGGGDADQQAAAVSPRRGPSLPFAASLFAASPSTSTSGRGRSAWPPEADGMEKKRWDSMESWSMLLDTVMGSGGEGSSRDSGRREEWMADLSQLFIGNKFASGANSRIYRGIYKQRAVAVKMVRIPERDEARRAELEEQFNSEVAFLSRLYHPNIVQVPTRSMILGLSCRVVSCRACMHPPARDCRSID